MCPHTYPAAAEQRQHDLWSSSFLAAKIPDHINSKTFEGALNLRLKDPQFSETAIYQPLNYLVYQP